MEVWWIGAKGSVQQAFWYEGAEWVRRELAPDGSASTSGGITAVSRIPGSMEVWWIGANGSVQQAFWYEGAEWVLRELASPGSASPLGGITAVSRIPGSMEVWWIGANGSVQDAFWYEGVQWQQFEVAPPRSASPSSGISAVSRVPSSMEVWWIGPNGSVHDAFWYNGAPWQRFELAPSGSASASGGIAAVSRIPMSMELWWTVPDGSVQDAFWYDEVPGDGIRRNIATVDPAERAMLRDAFLELNRRFLPGSRFDRPPGGVTWWFKQDEIHQATHVHGGPEFLPWHREIVNRLEGMLRQIDHRVTLHYWDWTQDPRSIPNANLGGGTTGTLNLFTPDFMGYGGPRSQPIGPPWQNAAPPWRLDGYYLPGIFPDRDGSGNPADPPESVTRYVEGSPASKSNDGDIMRSGDYSAMRLLLENVHNAMHGFVSMGGSHISFRDPFVFLLHSNVDRLFAMWQTMNGHPERLNPNTVYGSESGDARLNRNVEPWSTGHSVDQFGREHFTRPWSAPENEGIAKSYKDPSVVTPRPYDTLPYIWRQFELASSGSSSTRSGIAAVSRIANSMEVW
jgi:hypothetical protein